jgi:hypothetical protein
MIDVRRPESSRAILGPELCLWARVLLFLCTWRSVLPRGGQARAACNAASTLRDRPHAERSRADHFSKWADDLSIEGGLDAVDAIIKSCVNGARPSLDFPEVRAELYGVRCP